jgi:iron complex transport system substrate-binding protein
VEELIELAGGEPVFPKLRFERNAKSRAVTSDAVIAANPEVILASWCGRKVDKHKIREREGWSAVAAIQAGHVYEIVSSYILQPGPASLTEGARQLHRILAKVVNCDPLEGLEPSERLDPDFTL